VIVARHFQSKRRLFWIRKAFTPAPGAVGRDKPQKFAEKFCGVAQNLFKLLLPFQMILLFWQAF